MRNGSVSRARAEDFQYSAAWRRQVAQAWTAKWNSGLPRAPGDAVPQVGTADVPWHAWPAHWINHPVALSSSAMVHKPLGLLAELTHRCPLGCPYCSNPLALDAREDELDTATWVRVFDEAAGLGVLQVHLSGGEPGARRDLVDITAGAHAAGLYTNLSLPRSGSRTRPLARSPRPGSTTCRSPSKTAMPRPPTTSLAMTARLPGSGHSRPRSFAANCCSP